MNAINPTRKRESYSHQCPHFTIQWEEEHQVLSAEIIGPQDGKTAQLFKQSFLECIDTLPEEQVVDFIVDVTHQGKADKSSREVSSQIPKHPQFGRAAIYGLNAFARTTATFVMFAAGKSNLFRACKTKQEALDWLHSKR